MTLLPSEPAAAQADSAPQESLPMRLFPELLPTSLQALSPLHALLPTRLLPP